MIIEFYRCGDCQFFEKHEWSTFWQKGICQNPQCAVVETKADWTPAEAHLLEEADLINDICPHDSQMEDCYHPLKGYLKNNFNINDLNILELLRELEVLQLIEDAKKNPG